MPYRRVPVVTNEIYHVFNRSVARQPIFPSSKFYQRALDIVDFYRFADVPFRFSHYHRLPLLDRRRILEELRKKGRIIIDLMSFCFMPNHIHFLVKQTTNQGISTFMSQFQNSYAKYFNILTDRTGAVFQSMFKAVRIETEEQFLHVSRYIHLNPYTSYVVNSLQELATYPWTSFQYYLRGTQNEYVNTTTVLDFFPSIEEFSTFTYDQADYQRELANIRHLLLE